MFNLIKAENEDVNDRFPEGCCYKFIKDDEYIGIAVINNDEDDKIYIYIKKELRGNGYGKILFSEIIKELVKMEYKNVIVKFEKGNNQMLKIIENNRGVHISTDRGIVRYLLEFKSE